MAYCFQDFVPFLPTPWRDLAKLDEHIIADLASDRKNLTDFVDWLSRKNAPGSCFESFVQVHPTLCRSAIVLLTTEERTKYSVVAEKVQQLANGREGSRVFFSGYDYLGLPENWRGPRSQENAMIAYLETHKEDLDLFVAGLGLSGGVDMACGTYPRLCLSAVAMLYRYRSNDQQYLSTLSRVQRYASSLILGEYNEILVKYGCSYGLGALCGWLLENDPRQLVIETNQKILGVEAEIARQKRDRAEPDPALLNELQGCHDRLKDLARPYRISPDPWKGHA